MNNSVKYKTLYLQVENSEHLERGLLSTHSFDHFGGTIGSKGANWLLNDYSGSIATIHTEITIRDNCYCLIDRSGQTRINSSIDFIGLNRIIQLNEGDTIHIGRYKIKINFHEISRFISGKNNTLDQRNMTEIIDQKHHRNQINHLLSNEKEDGLIFNDKNMLNHKEVSISIDSILINEVPKEILDPLAAFSNTESLNTTFINTKNHDDFISEMSHTEQSFKDNDMYKKQTKHNQSSGESFFMNAPLDSHEKPPRSNQYDPLDQNPALDNAIFTPLLKGMGISIEEMDSEKAQDFLNEVGQTIQVAISGIQALYHQNQKDNLKPSLLNRNLQPIEDNPLRLHQTCKETTEALFSPERSRVHLSPPEAITESLTQLKQHQDSVIIATQESLNALLEAFSPDVLQKRFERYAKTGEKGIHDDAWSWQMYNAYYEELISPRQTGFEKLFWEVFEQAYDRTMRQKHNNSST